MLINKYTNPNIEHLKKEIELFLQDDDSGLIILEHPVTNQDFLIEYVPTEGYSSTSDNGISVGLSTELDEQLIQEGAVRDVIRQVQILRKDAGFAVEDRIHVFTDLSPEITPAIEKFKEYFSKN